MSLTIEALKEKIARVETDIEELRQSGDASRKTEVLLEYKKYLEEELEYIKNEQRQKKA